MTVLRHETLAGACAVWREAHPAERPHLLFATFQPAQWRLAFSPDGIGAGDMRPDQQARFAGLFGESVSDAPYAPFAAVWVAGVWKRIPDSATVRLRLRRDEAAGKPAYEMAFPRTAQGHRIFTDSDAEVEEFGAESVFGVLLTATLPNRAKPSVAHACASCSGGLWRTQPAHPRTLRVPSLRPRRTVSRNSGRRGAQRSGRAR